MFFEGSERKKPSKTKKTSAQKTTNICIFLKELVHGLIFSFYAKWIKKRGFLKVAREKKPFWTIKRIRSKKPPKSAFFLKGLVHGFCQKNGDFLSLVYMQNGSRNSVF